MKEGSFIGQVVNTAKYHKSRLRPHYIPAIQEAFPTEKIPPFAEKKLTSEEAKVLLKFLIKPEEQVRLNELVSSLPAGQYRYREAAGTPEQGNRHVHDFVIMKNASGVQLFWVDPEHAMGVNENKNFLKIPRRGDLRPKINVLYSMELTPEGEVARISLIRYRAAVIPKEKVELNKPSEQLKMAQLMLATGELPEVFQGKENEITFQLDYRVAPDHHRVSVRARENMVSIDTVEKMLAKLAAGQALNSKDPLEGQLERFRPIVRTHFPKNLKENKFKPLE